MKNATMRVLSVSLVVALGFVNVPLRGDTVVLKNGNKIEGQVIDNRDTTGQVIVRFGELGHMKLRTSEIADILSSPDVKAAAVPEAEVSTTVLTAADAPSADPQPGDAVTVQLPETSDSFYAVSGAPRRGIYRGILSANSDEKTIVLEIPDAGTIRIPRVDGLVMARKGPDFAAEKPAGDAQVIKTTHVVQLKNGRKLQGNVIPTPESEPVKLQIGHFGIMAIRRGTIAPDGIRAVDGLIELPEQPAEPEPPARPILPDAVREELKGQIRDEVLREIIDRKIDNAIDSMFDRQDVRSFGMLLDPGFGLSDEQADEIATQIHELTRQRTTNRVRAEASLKRLGSPALPFLENVASHPFNLTRRAVQRIVADIGNLSGAPIAIGALNDSDDFVRKIAGENVKAFLGASFSYDPEASEAERVEAQNQLWNVWDEVVRNMARERVLAKIATAN